MNEIGILQIYINLVISRVNTKMKSNELNLAKNSIVKSVRPKIAKY